MLYEIKLKVNKENIKGEVKEVIEHYIASFTEIQSVVIRSLKSEINELCKTGEIDKHKTLNGWAFSITET